MRRPTSPLIALLLIGALAVAASLWRSDPPERPAIGAALTGRVTIIDGDSLTLSGQTVRLSGVDAPEGRQSCRDRAGRDYPCGRAAADALRRLVQGRAVTCTPVQEDRYERAVSVCAVEGRDLGEAMVRAGHAVELPAFSRGRYADAERDARAASRGLWAGTFERPAEWRARQ